MDVATDFIDARVSKVVVQDVVKMFEQQIYSDVAVFTENQKDEQENYSKVTIGGSVVSGEGHALKLIVVLVMVNDAATDYVETKNCITEDLGIFLHYGVFTPLKILLNVE